VLGSGLALARGDTPIPMSPALNRTPALFAPACGGNSSVTPSTQSVPFVFPRIIGRKVLDEAKDAFAQREAVRLGLT
jgi:hypothetical protein